ncbi:MAG TPA: FAD-dependent oxidoreductase [bacterium]|nr:FAD-dependent oxidoreductase [bacterium]
MPHYRYVIVGGGMTADAAIGGIRQADPAGTIGLIGTEPHPPYNRPPLSKALWKGKSLDSIWRRTDRQGVDLHLGRTVRSLDVKSKRVSDDRGTDYTWDKLLLATGGSPRRLPAGGEAVVYFRSLDDYTQLRALTERAQRFAVIGSGFIGSEIAAALAMNRKDVVMLFPGEGIGGRMFPPDLSTFLNDYYRQKGVELGAGERVVSVTPAGTGFKLVAQSGHEWVVGGVVAGLGITPNTDLARESGLEVHDGIVVDEGLRTTHPDVYAAGDVASFFSPVLGKRLRVEHEDNANAMGSAAGLLMGGQGAPYRHLPYFYSDLFDLGYEAVGDLDPRLETVADWKDPYREGVVYYVQQGRVRGVLLWNVWDQIEAARALIAEPGPIRPEDLNGRLPSPR